MHGLAAQIWTFLVHSGPLGVLIIGALDSSFMVMPFGMDILIAALVARNPSGLPVYVLAGVTGSVIGVTIVDLLIRKSGEKGLEKVMKPAQIERLRQKVEKRAIVMLVTASLAPPPFPFTAVIVGTSALQYPRTRMLVVVFASRFVRFLAVALLAIFFGPGILRVIEASWFQWFMVGFTFFCIAASAISLVRWIRRIRQR